MNRGAQHGLTADALRDFEVFLNRKYPRKGRPITVVALPTTRDRLLSTSSLRATRGAREAL
jgi:hypothetical protein